MRWNAVLASVVGLGLVAPAQALGAGGPVPPVQGGRGLSVARSPFRYVADRAGRFTIVKRVAGDGNPAVTVRLPGQYGIPGVDFNGGRTGLSADGGTLVVAAVQRGFPPRTSRLIVLDTRRMAVRARISLPGWSNVDAISPNGRWLYLIHYVPSNLSRYSVLAYDLRDRRLLARPIVDPRDRGEAMTGFPVSRVMSADGRWAYTLYTRPSNATGFVHALDTAGRRAVCIDLPSASLNGAVGSAQIRLGAGGTQLRVETGRRTLATVDTRTLAVVAPDSGSPAESNRAAAHSGAPAGDGGVPWELIAGPLLGLAALGTLGAVAARRRAIS